MKQNKILEYSTKTAKGNRPLSPICRRERRFFDICIPNVRLRNNGSNVGPTSLLQILAIQGEGEGKKSDRKDRK